MDYILTAFLIIVILYWFFNIKKQNVITISLPIEKMSNISIFDGNKI
jgi:hypothetical protein